MVPETSWAPPTAGQCCGPRSGAIKDLNSLIPPSTFMLTKAVGINNVGTIIATGHEVFAGHGAGTSHEDQEHDLPVRVFLLIRSGGGQ